MKAKKFKKKLSLNKRTVAHLGDSVMEHVRGGAEWTDICGPSLDWRISAAPYTCRLLGCPKPPTCIQQNSCGC